jgi:hypothetical protein
MGWHSEPPDVQWGVHSGKEALIEALIDVQWGVHSRREVFGGREVGMHVIC